MDLKRIIAAEENGQRAIRSVRPFVTEGDTRAALSAADYILSEARHYAVCWDDIRAREDAKTIDAEAAKKERQDVIFRLSSALAPSRL